MRPSKKIKSLGFLLAFLLFGIPIFSQKNISLRGRVVDISGGAGGGNATITLLNKDSSLNKITVADSSGFFKIDSILPAYYRVGISRVGLKDTLIPVELKEHTDMGNIYLAVGVQAAEQALVLGKKKLVERKIDRIVFNVENSPLLAGGTALDALKKVSGVRVDEEGVSIIGKSRVIVMINDKPTNMSGAELLGFLQSLNSATIAQIELITVPPAKYDAAGNSGIINIRLKRNPSFGLNGFTNLGYEQKTYPGFFVGLNLNYRQGKVTTFFNYNLRRPQRNPLERSTIESNETWYNEVDRRLKSLSNNFRGGVEYNVSKSTTLGLLYMLVTGIPSEDNRSVTRQNSKTNPLIDTVFQTRNRINDKVFTQSYNLNVQNEKNKHILSFDADYFHTRDDKQQLLEYLTYNRNKVLVRHSYARATAPQTVKIYSVKTDYTRKLEHEAAFSAGLKYSYSEIINDYDFRNSSDGSTYITDPGISNRFEYTERIYAAYTNYSRKFTKSELQVGLRVEETSATGYSVTLNQRNNQRYTRLFPSFYYQVNVTDNDIVNFSYGTRIGRPAYRELNPFRVYLNPVQYVEGNPYLQPSYTHNFELSYQLNEKYTFKLYDQLILREFQQVPVFKNDTLRFSRLNTGNLNNTGLDINVPVTLRPWWEADNDISIFVTDQRINYESGSLKYRNLSTTIFSTHRIQLSKKNNFRSEVQAVYIFPARSFIYRTDGFFTMSIALSAQVLQKKGTLSLSFNDIFFSGNPKSTTNDFGQYILFANRSDSRFFRLNFNYRFGSSKVKQFKNRRQSNEEETRRAG